MEGIIDMSARTVIKDILDVKHKSQVELAEDINVTRQNLSNKMNRDKFSALELVEIADALDMNLILKDKESGKEYIIDYPDDLKGKSKRNMTEEEKTVIDEFQGKEAYEKVMAHSDFYLNTESGICLLPNVS